MKSVFEPLNEDQMRADAAADLQARLTMGLIVVILLGLMVASSAIYAGLRSIAADTRATVAWACEIGARCD